MFFFPPSNTDTFESVWWSSVQFNHVWLFVTPLTVAQETSLSPTLGIYSNSCPLSRWCNPTISSSVVPFSSGPQSFPASGSFQMSQFLESDGQRTGVSASASVLSMNIQDWFPLGWTGWISLLSKGLSRVFLALSLLYDPTLTCVHYMITWKP